jgi:hypothetical protein
MNAIYLLSLLLTSPASGKTSHVHEGEPPAPSSALIQLQVQYVKTGREDEAAAAKLGEIEIANANPCIGQMRRDVLALETRKELRQAVDVITDTFTLDARVKPRLVIRYMNEAMELRFEMITPAVKGPDGSVSEPEKVKYRKGSYISDASGTWQERLDADKCHVSEEKFFVLIDELREADRLAACVMRKHAILDGSQKVSNYLHNYLPVSWLDEAKRHLVLQNSPVNGLLREDASIYRTGNSTFRDCQRGLRLLEEDASSSVRVLNEVRESKKGTDVPAQEIDDLEHLLSGVAK